MTPAANWSENVVDFSPSEFVKRQSMSWRGLRAELLQFTHHEPIEYKFLGNQHILLVAEQAHRYDGETAIEGSSRSTLHNFSGKLTFVPAGFEFHGWQRPRVLPRLIYFYLDPASPLISPQTRFDSFELRPRLFFDDKALYETALKLKSQVEDPSTPLYAEALGMVLAQELLRLDRPPVNGEQAVKGGLAAWQRKRVTDYIEEHLAETVSIVTLAEIAGLSPFHFARMFKQSFGVPPHRYHMVRRIERAKTLLSRPEISITQAGLRVGFSQTSSFTAAFRKIAHATPSDFRRRLE